VETASIAFRPQRRAMALSSIYRVTNALRLNCVGLQTWRNCAQYQHSVR